jgi:uncharacterized membrane protein YkvA (DUF1232 family)
MNKPDRSGDQERELFGWFRDFLSQFALAWKLIWDPRVPLSTKLVPLVVVAYVLLPFDIVPDAFLGLGQVDDLVLVLVGLRTFVSLCPPEVVSAYRKVKGAEADADWVDSDTDVIELEARLPAEASPDEDPSESE